MKLGSITCSLKNFTKRLVVDYNVFIEQILSVHDEHISIYTCANEHGRNQILTNSYVAHWIKKLTDYKF